VTSSPPPAWVHKRDGRLVPFEADKISRSLFAAGEHLGRPDPFMARELTDSIVHFLAGEAEGRPLTTTQIAEMVVKVVRELGQPELAAAFTAARRQPTPGLYKTAPAEPPEITVRFSPAESLPTILERCARDYARHVVFARDLVAAHNDGLLLLTGLERPLELAGCVLTPSGAGRAGLVESIEETRHLAGGMFAVDGPEHGLTQRPGADGVADWARELGIGLRLTGLRAAVNLNCAVPPSWADDLAAGPLFAGTQRRPTPERLAEVADLLLEYLLGLSQPAGLLRLDWHLGERDFMGTERLLRVVRRALEGALLAFVFDRGRRPAALAEGMDRQHPAVLLAVGLSLPRLATQPGMSAEAFVQKLGSLARLALSAAVQKRDFLRRRRPETGRGFLLDRARLVVVPLGLEAAVRQLTGKGLCGGGAALELARASVRRLRDVLRQDGGTSRLETCLDSLPTRPPAEAGGLTAWDATAPLKQQLRAAGVLHAVAEQGTASLLLSPDSAVTAEQLADTLRWAWQQTDVVRLRLVRVQSTAEQLDVPWPES
jgi:ATP cone domain